MIVSSLDFGNYISSASKLLLGMIFLENQIQAAHGNPVIC